MRVRVANSSPRWASGPKRALSNPVGRPVQSQWTPKGRSGARPSRLTQANRRRSCLSRELGAFHRDLVSMPASRPDPRAARLR
jgi:hypothetical protein